MYINSSGGGEVRVLGSFEEEGEARVFASSGGGEETRVFGSSGGAVGEVLTTGV